MDLYMSPVLPTHNRRNRLGRNAILSGQPVLGRPGAESLPNVPHLIGGQFGPPGSFTESLATFLVSVLHVVQVSSQKEVGGVDASRVIAGVADMHSGGNLAVCDLPRNNMGSVCPATHAEGSIPLQTIQTSHPDPAVIRPVSFDLRPEAIFHRLLSRLRNSNHCGGPARHVAVSSAQPVRWNEERRSARFACLWGTIEVHSDPPVWVPRLGLLPTAPGLFACLQYTSFARFYGLFRRNPWTSSMI